jgi:hypothetical protein
MEDDPAAVQSDRNWPASATNQMLCADPSSGETPDLPSSNDGRNDPANPKAFSSWPTDRRADGRGPRAS